MAQKKRIALTVPEDLHEVLHRIADLTDKTVTTVIGEILRDSKKHLYHVAQVLENVQSKQADLAVQSIHKLVEEINNDSSQMQMELGALNYQIKEGKKHAPKKK